MSKTLKNVEAQTCLQKLMRIWFDFERKLNRVPIIHRLEQGSFTIDDHRKLLLNMRQQVIEGSRWISRCASSFDREHSDIRSMIITHAKEEHRDYEMLEQDFVNAGGKLEMIHNREKNIGSEALHGYMMYGASKENPVGMIGAMWIIEGMGEKMASNWAKRIDELINMEPSCTQFLSYHGVNDDDHMEKFYIMLDRVCDSEKSVIDIVKTAKTVGRLYLLQLEEIDTNE